MISVYPELSPKSTQVALGRQLDGFLSARVSFKKVIFEFAGKYDSGTLLWDTSLSGTGSSTHSTTDGGVTLSTGGTASGAKAIRQTHQYLIYSPGKSRQSISGVLFGTAATNLRRRHGLFDADNGLFLEQISSGIRLVTRTNSSGSPVDTTIAQTAWNLDKLDGTGASGLTLDLTKGQALVIEFTGYNAATSRFGFLINNDLIYVHEITNANVSTSFGIGSSVVPLRYEIENTGVTSGTNTIKASSCVVFEEDGYPDDFSYEFGASRGITELGVTTRVPLISIRPKTTFGGITNRGHVHLTHAAVIARTNNALIQIVRGGTLTGAAWVSASTNSIAEYDLTATAITGGEILTSDYAVAGSGSVSQRISGDLNSKFGLFNDFLGTTTDIMTIVATSVTGTSNLLGAMNWDEQR